jgi:mycofactocin system glycosyltransferase
MLAPHRDRALEDHAEAPLRTHALESPPGRAEAPPPAELRVAVNPAVRVLERGRLLVGGSPFRVLRLTEDGARAISEWETPSPVGECLARRVLARRLLDVDILAAHPAPAAAMSALTVVVPVRDRPAQLARCLDAVLTTCPESPVIVVDDGSRDRAAVHAVCLERGVAVSRHDAWRGAAAARNTGLAACSTPYVAFVDSDVVLPPSCAARLLGHFADPAVGAVAPRVRALPPSRGIIGRYEERHSALDMGPNARRVAPGLPTAYVPGTVLVVRRSAAAVGFDETLPIGEDVDFVWRLSRAGWRVRYDPAAHVWHDHRERLRAFASRRRLYAESVAMLARRHPDAVPAARLSPWMAVPWALALLGHRRAALGATAVAVLLLGTKLRGVPGRPYPLAAALVARGLIATGLGLAHAVRRAWSPPLLALAPSRPGVRRILLAAFAAPIVQDALATRRLRALPGDAPIRLLDEAIALVGTWEGCIRQRTIRPLLPSWRTASSRRGRGMSLGDRFEQR